RFALETEPFYADPIERAAAFGRAELNRPQAIAAIENEIMPVTPFPGLADTIRKMREDLNKTVSDAHQELNGVVDDAKDLAKQATKLFERAKKEVEDERAAFGLTPNTPPADK